MTATFEFSGMTFRVFFHSLESGGESVEIAHEGRAVPISLSFIARLSAGSFAEFRDFMKAAMREEASHYGEDV